MSDCMEGKQPLSQLRSLTFALGRLAEAQISGRLLVATASVVLHLGVSLSDIIPKDVPVACRCLGTFDTLQQLFVFFFVRMNQMRRLRQTLYRLNNFRSNCVCLVFAAYGLLFRRKRETFQRLTGAATPAVTMSDRSSMDEVAVFVAPISPNVSDDHLREIMGNFGHLCGVEISDVDTPHGATRIARIAYESTESVESAIKHMDKGQIDGLRVRVTAKRPEPRDIPKTTL
ncbi:RIBONUCLEIC ACID BINDING PROTEIN S1, putative [Babesia bigemina]|uniref:RIBONUCLEIC ACID BINDING PROTEIN S1, putative n=1 Tax=Babesia bigemina TaxID=5866 RepID=A0A061D7I7_BABBI|nr:RIBONUCLEIC ACID BINDING PROTEIN S1, putative [Babesia bigemina]CDR96666.1 RIBONUCLEIC ACID BINDING PROTEIN S1, putative [Babesia bigemina]|eukprot:XP_012768852.1 RIBONUCLEIC ACID BINDING PROTEIN S1, putative [Babesia bigemina]